MVTRDEARSLAANVVKLPEPLQISRRVFSYCVAFLNVPHAIGSALASLQQRVFHQSPAARSESGTQTGGLLRMGIEYAFLPNWSAKIEYNFIDFGTRSFNAPISTNPSLAGTPLAGITSIHFNTIFDNRK